MRYFIPDTIDSYGGSSSRVPSVMDTDPHADEEIINQQAGEQYPKAVEQPGKIAPDGLADSIAYALDGSGPGLTGDIPNVSGHKTITEGITGAGLSEEEDVLRS